MIFYYMRNLVKGFKDLIGDEAILFSYIEDISKKLLMELGFDIIYTPILEHKQLIEKSSGSSSDIVTKEMFHIVHKKHDIILRPEQTPSILSCVLHNNINRGYFFSIGPMFRHENTQSGRLRQFNQVSVEFIGDGHYLSDCNLIITANKLLKIILKNNLENIDLEINYIGNFEERKEYINYLTTFFNENKNDLSIESQLKIDVNPLRILDSKHEQDILLFQKLDKNISDFLKHDSQENFKNILNVLDVQQVLYTINYVLVRGLEYYNNIVFEYKSKILDGKVTLLAGGRYDYLSNIIMNEEKLSSTKNVPSVGFALGIERVATHLKGEISNYKEIIPQHKKKQAIIISLDISTSYLENIFNILSSQYNVIIMNNRTLKAMLQTVSKQYNTCEMVIICGKDEEQKKQVIIKNFQLHTDKTIFLDQLSEII